MEEFDDDIDETRVAFWKKIESIEGLSVSDGLDRFDGERDEYERTLKFAIRDMEKSGSLRELLSSGNFKNFRIIAHGIKGSLLSIGETVLSAKAYALETASDRNDSDFCGVNLPRFLDDINELKNKIQEAFSLIVESDGPAEIPPELPSVFEKLQSAFDEIDLMAINRQIEILNKLKAGGALKDGIEQIKEAVMMMDYKTAAVCMQSILRSN